MSLRSAQEIAAIHGLVDNWLKITDYSTEKPSNPWNDGPYNFKATLRPYADSAEEAAAAVTPRQIRAVALRRAEDALDALADAGWQFTQCPVLEFGGQVTLTGTFGAWSSSQNDLSLTVRFQVNMPRAEEEMDPERLVDKILGPIV